MSYIIYLLFYCYYYLVAKIAFKNSLDLYFYSFIIGFIWSVKLQLRIEKKIYTNAVFMCLQMLVESFPVGLRVGLFSKTEDLYLKFRSKSNPAFTKNGCLHSAILNKGFTTREEIVNFSLKMFKLRFLRYWKCWRTTWDSSE